MGPEIIDGLKFQKDIDGSKKLIIESSKLDSCIKYVLEGKKKEITINCFQGYYLDNIDFLNEVSNVLEGLHLPESKFDIKVVNKLYNLKSLGFADNKKDIIDLSNFPKLESLACDYSSRLEGLNKCNNLKNLSLTGYISKTNDLSELPPFLYLEDIHLYVTNIATLEGIERFTNLKDLEIFRAKNLKTIEALQGLTDCLEVIQIMQCKKINDFEILGKVKSLRKMILSDSGEIKNLAFVKELPRLEFISFCGTNVLDGNIEYCVGINYVGFDNKRHYNHKFEQFKKNP